MAQLLKKINYFCFNLILGCWTSQTVANQYLTKHNLLWPGALFVQDMNTGAHGFFYNGDGIKNLDLPFMI